MKSMRLLLILLLTVVLGATGAMAQGMDRDGDGVPNRRDQCPGVAGLPELNGCPPILVEVLPTGTDTDNDGLPDSDDECPTIGGPRENRGCPVSNDPPVNDPPPSEPPVNDPPPADPDTDGDGTPDSGDECPTVPGPRENRGCPPVDNPPVSEPPSSVPPFVPPTLPPDRCTVTAANPNNINVRKAPELAAEIIGFLLPGVVYPADGFVMNGAEVWYVLSSYENSTGDTGYTSGMVVLSANCRDLTPGTDATTRPGAADSFETNPPYEALCYLSVGYDPAYYGSGYDASLGNEPVVYAAFYFELEPGTPITPGTPIWGVVSINGFHELPPESPLFFADPDNAVAVASDPAVISAAMNGGVGTAFNLAFPNPNGGVRAANGTTFYRLSSPEHVGNCGPIVSIDDFAPVPTNGDTAALQCFTQQGTTLVESCWCETSDSDCIDTLVDICWGGGAYIDAGPDMTACWWVNLEGPSDDLVQAQGRNAMVRHAINRFNRCADDLTVWWAEVPNPYGDPFRLHDIDGHCGYTFDAVFDTPLQVGQTRIIAGQPSRTVFPTGGDCDDDGVPDNIQFPQPICLDDLTSDIPDGSSAKETPGWWAQVLNLTCGGSGWIMTLEIDEDGEEVVTDAVCDD